MNWGYPDFRLRKVALDPTVSGELYLSHLPGRCGDEASPQHTFARDRQIVVDAGITTVICLLDREEIDRKSIAYGWALAGKRLPWQTTHFPIADFGVPESNALWKLAGDAGAELSGGSKLLIHCAAGIGRTGLVATATLMALGMPLSRAMLAVQEAGSGAETEEQQALLAELALRTMSAGH